MSTDSGTIGGPFYGFPRYENTYAALGVNRLAFACPGDEIDPLKNIMIELHLGSFQGANLDEKGRQDCRRLLRAVEEKWVVLISRAHAEALKERLNRIISGAEIAKHTAAVGEEVRGKLE